jgi:hypothetical protein
MLSAELSRKPVLLLSTLLHLLVFLLKVDYSDIRILTSAADEFLEEKWISRQSGASHGHGPDLYINERGSKVWEIQPGLGSFG